MSPAACKELGAVGSKHSTITKEEALALDRTTVLNYICTRVAKSGEEEEVRSSHPISSYSDNLLAPHSPPAGSSADADRLQDLKDSHS